MNLAVTAAVIAGCQRATTRRPRLALLPGLPDLPKRRPPSAAGGMWIRMDDAPLKSVVRLPDQELIF
jgi:hypothetical protein